MRWGDATILETSYNSSDPQTTVGKDKTECSSYRLISVLNMDYRLNATILPKRIEDIVPDLIDTVQNVFPPPSAYCQCL